MATQAPVLAVFVLDHGAAERWEAGAASRWWLHHSLDALGRSIAAAGGQLILRRGETAEVLAGLVEESGARAVHCSRSYEPWAAALEAAVHARLAQSGVALKRFAGTLLHEPEQLTTQSGGAFKVFTPFWRALRTTVDVGRPLAPPKRIASVDLSLDSDDLRSWKLLPTKPDWARGLRDAWTPGEAGARERLNAFRTDGLSDYAVSRDRPDQVGTSRLSPHLAFGEISPRQCWWGAQAQDAGEAGSDVGRATFLKELAWREFSAHLLHHWPDLPQAPFRPAFAAFPWRNDARHLAAWQQGRTGYPIVDAGMRELWTTGWMHNRVRMIVASFLIKHLLVPWQEGEAWFWDTLVDADLANNAANWQWVAGSGSDAVPYFRIFNPVTQGEKFDPDGGYVRRWVPELARLPAPAIHAPWRASQEALAAAKVDIGTTYPAPIVDHVDARRAALAAFAGLKLKPEPAWIANMRGPDKATIS